MNKKKTSNIARRRIEKKRRFLTKGFGDLIMDIASDIKKIKLGTYKK